MHEAGPEFLESSKFLDFACCDSNYISEKRPQSVLMLVESGDVAIFVEDDAVLAFVTGQFDLVLKQFDRDSLGT